MMVEQKGVVIMSILCGVIGHQTKQEEDHTIYAQANLQFNDAELGIVGYATIQGKSLEHSIIPGKALVLGNNFFPREKPISNHALNGGTPASADDYTTEGLPLITRRDGVYAFVFWDQDQALLWIGTDRYGLRPFYYCHRDGELAFATESDWLVRHSVKKFSVNYSAVCQYICLRHPFGDETLFQEIRRLPQGRVLRYSVKEDQLRSVPHFSYLSFRPEPSLTVEQVLAEAPARFMAALNRQVNGAKKALLPLSGGYDSRIIACGLNLLGVELMTYTTHKDYGWTTDTVAAAEVAKLLGTDHHYQSLPRNYLACYHQRKCRLVNFETSYHPWVVNLLTMLPENPLPCFDGLGGDACLGGSEVLPQFWRLWRKEDYRQLLTVYFRWYKTHFEQLITAKYHATIKQLAHKKIRSELNKLKGNPNGLIYLGLRNFTRRAIALSTFGIIGHQQSVRTPFFDPQFFEWTLSIPVRLKVQSKIYDQIFRIVSDKTAVVPNTHQRPDHSRYFRKVPELWRNRHNRAYLAKMIKRLPKFLPGFIKPELPEKLKKGKMTRAERDSLLSLADLAYWFETYKDHLKIRGWMK